MTKLLSQYPAALRTIARLMRHPRHQAFVLAVVVIVGVGVAFFSIVEGWSVIDSFYFTIIALTTVGFGDFTPTSEGSRLFTALYALIGVGIIGTAVHLVVTNARAAAQLASGDVEAARRTADIDLD